MRLGKTIYRYMHISIHLDIYMCALYINRFCSNPRESTCTAIYLPFSVCPMLYDICTNVKWCKIRVIICYNMFFILTTSTKLSLSLTHTHTFGLLLLINFNAITTITSTFSSSPPLVLSHSLYVPISIVVLFIHFFCSMHGHLLLSLLNRDTDKIDIHTDFI